MKIKLTDMKRIIKEEVEKQFEKIAEIAQDSVPGPEVDPKDAVEDLDDFREEDVAEALKSLDEEKIKEMVMEMMKEKEE